MLLSICLKCDLTPQGVDAISYDLPRFSRLRHGDGPWSRSRFKAIIHYLGRNAKGLTPSAMPERTLFDWDAKPIFQRSDQKALTDHSEQPAAA